MQVEFWHRSLNQELAERAALSKHDDNYDCSYAPQCPHCIQMLKDNPWMGARVWGP